MNRKEEVEQKGRTAALFCPQCNRRLAGFAMRIPMKVFSPLPPDLAEEVKSASLAEKIEAVTRSSRFYTMEIQNIVELSRYCPDCHIIRTCMMSLPILCGDCGFHYWQQDPDRFLDPTSTGPCWLCGGKMKGMSVAHYNQQERAGNFDSIILVMEAMIRNVNKVAQEDGCGHLFLRAVEPWKGKVSLAECQICKKWIYYMP